MATKFVLDTHALIWYLEGSARLSPSAKAIMDDPASEMILPAIALAEAVYIVDKGRTSISSSADLLRDVSAEKRIQVQPLTFEVIQESLSAGGVAEMHDRLIVATAIHEQKLGHQVSLLTCDANITSSGLATTIW
jgi:PIN domain nuclease of toxin-antitoxin system